MVTVLPETVQTAGVLEEKMTGRPEEAVAVIENDPTPMFTNLRAAIVTTA